MSRGTLAIPIEQGTEWFRCCFSTLPRSYTSHTLAYKMCRTIESEHLVLGPQGSNAYRFLSFRKYSLPLSRVAEHENDHLVTLDLPSSWVEPDSGLILLSAEQDHVMVGGNHHLSGLLCVVEDFLV